MHVWIFISLCLCIFYLLKTKKSFSLFNDHIIYIQRNFSIFWYALVSVIIHEYVCPLTIGRSLCKVAAMHITSRTFLFAFFLMSFDRAWAANHENILFSLRRNLLAVEKYEILEENRLLRIMYKIVGLVLFFRFSIKNWVWTSI